MTARSTSDRSACVPLAREPNNVAEVTSGYHHCNSSPRIQMEAEKGRKPAMAQSPYAVGGQHERRGERHLLREPKALAVPLRV